MDNEKLEKLNHMCYVAEKKLTAAQHIASRDVRLARQFYGMDRIVIVSGGKKKFYRIP